jgi:DNA-binding transcriptional ArsR family regulator
VTIGKLFGRDARVAPDASSGPSSNTNRARTRYRASDREWHSLPSCTPTLTTIDSRFIAIFTMTDPEQTLNRALHAIADPTRRRILQALKERGACSIGKDVGLCASDIELRIHLSQPTISHHMSILKKAGLVEAKKLGQWMWYRRNEMALRAFARKLRESL